MTQLLTILQTALTGDGGLAKVRGLIVLGLTAAFIHGAWTGQVSPEIWVPVATGAIGIYTMGRFMDGKNGG